MALISDYRRETLTREISQIVKDVAATKRDTYRAAYAEAVANTEPGAAAPEKYRTEGDLRRANPAAAQRISDSRSIARQKLQKLQEEILFQDLGGPRIKPLPDEAMRTANAWNLYKPSEGEITAFLVKYGDQYPLAVNVANAAAEHAGLTVRAVHPIDKAEQSIKAIFNRAEALINRAGEDTEGESLADHLLKGFEEFTYSNLGGDGAYNGQDIKGSIPSEVVISLDGATGSTGMGQTAHAE